MKKGKISVSVVLDGIAAGFSEQEAAAIMDWHRSRMDSVREVHGRNVIEIFTRDGNSRTLARHYLDAVKGHPITDWPIASMRNLGRLFDERKDLAFIQKVRPVGVKADIVKDDNSEMKPELYTHRQRRRRMPVWFSAELKTTIRHFRTGNGGRTSMHSHQLTIKMTVEIDPMGKDVLRWNSRVARNQLLKESQAVYVNPGRFSGKRLNREMRNYGIDRRLAVILPDDYEWEDLVIRDPATFTLLSDNRIRSVEVKAIEDGETLSYAIFFQGGDRN